MSKDFTIDKDPNEERQFLVPIPDAIREGETAFSFDVGPPQIDLEKRAMSAPVELSELTRVTQLRQLGHAKWSPERRQIAGINPMILDAVERVRIDSLLCVSEFDKDLNIRTINDADMDYLTQHGRVDSAARLLLYGYQTGDRTMLEQKFRKKYGDQLAADIKGALNGQYMGHGSALAGETSHAKYLKWESTVKAAEEIEGLLRDYIETSEEQKKAPPPPSIPLQHGDEDVMKSLVSSSRMGSGGTKWSEMTLEEPPRPIALPPELMARQVIKSDTGAVPIAMHRATIDQRVFRSKRRKPGAGSVLIDQSGSMRMSDEDVVAIMEHLPGVIIAGYCTDHVQDPPAGQLRILAKRGHRVAAENLKINGGGNGCDGPALEWLATQPNPRFWVSDGHITALTNDGAGEGRPIAKLVTQVRNTCAQARILRVPDASALTLRLARKVTRA